MVIEPHGDALPTCMDNSIRWLSPYCGKFDGIVFAHNSLSHPLPHISAFDLILMASNDLTDAALLGPPADISGKDQTVPIVDALERADRTMSVINGDAPDQVSLKVDRIHVYTRCKTQFFASRNCGEKC
jgi:hypothetical protein